MLNLSDILKLSSLGSNKLFNLLKKNNIKLSKKVLNYSIKQVVITHILTSEDCYELRSDVDKLKAYTLSQLVNYLRVNYIQVRIEDILNNLWTVISKNMDRLDILKTDLEILLKADYFQFETVESLVKSSKEVFVDASNEVDGLDFLEAKKSYKLYSNIGFLRGELEQNGVSIPSRISKNDYAKRVLYALGSEASTYQERISSFSFDELDEFVKRQGLDVNGSLAEDDLIKLLVNYYASKNEVVTKVEYENLIKLDFEAVKNDDSFMSVARPTDEGLMSSIDDVLNFNDSNVESDETSQDDELDDILDELDEEAIEEEKEVSEPVIKPNYPDSFLNATINSDGSLSTQEEAKEESYEEENYNLNGLFDDDLIKSVLNDDVEVEPVKEVKEPVIKPNYPDSFLNKTINSDGSLSSEAKPKQELFDKTLVKEVIEEEGIVPDFEKSNIISDQIKEQIHGERSKTLDVRLTNLQSDFKVETTTDTKEESIEEVLDDKKSKKDKKNKKEKTKKIKNKKEKKVKGDKPRRSNTLLFVLLFIWILIMVAILLIRFM